MNSLFSSSSSGEQAPVEYHLVNLDKLMDDVKSVTDELNELNGLDQAVLSGLDAKGLRSRGMNATDIGLALQKAKLIKVMLEVKQIKDRNYRLNRSSRFIILSSLVSISLVFVFALVVTL